MDIMDHGADLIFRPGSRISLEDSMRNKTAIRLISSIVFLFSCLSIATFFMLSSCRERRRKAFEELDRDVRVIDLACGIGFRIAKENVIAFIEEGRLYRGTT